MNTGGEKRVVAFYPVKKRHHKKKRKSAKIGDAEDLRDLRHSQPKALHPLVIGQDVEGTSPGLVIGQAAFRLQSTHTVPLVGKSPAA